MQTRSSLLAVLEEKGIKTKTYDHPKVLTVEEHAEYLGHLEGGLCKNLFLKDKKNRLILISALTTTNIDMKALSQRLGLGKGGVRMAPEDSLQAILQVPLGCVTPFALLNESARSVVFLLDEGLKSKSQLYFHPLTNDATTAISPDGLEKFLQIIGREATYVNLEEIVVVGKDQPPDLAVYLVDAAASENKPKEPIAPENAVSLATLMGIGEPAVKPEAKVKGKQKEAKIVGKDVQRPSPSDVQSITISILDKVVSTICAEIASGVTEQTGKGIDSGPSKTTKQRLVKELEDILMSLKNTAYTDGFLAGLASSSLGKATLG